MREFETSGLVRLFHAISSTLGLGGVVSPQKIDRYRATCKACGHEGVLAVRTDASNGVTMYFEGLEASPVPPFLAPTSFDEKMSLPCPECGGKSVTLSSLFSDL
jgi:hypothetical protein